MLFKVSGSDFIIEIKCPRCGEINIFKSEPPEGHNIRRQ